MSPTEKALANLIPAKPGEVRNPTGINQFTYRADAEKHLDEWCKLNGQDLIDRICNEAKAKKPWAAKLMLDRILPAVTKHEHGFTDDPEEAALGDSLADLSRRRRTNGSGRPVDTSATEDAGS